MFLCLPRQDLPNVVVDLIHLRKVSMFEDAEVAEILNEISRWTVREKCMTITAYSVVQESGRFCQIPSSSCLPLLIKIYFLFLLTFSWIVCGICVELSLWNLVITIFHDPCRIGYNVLGLTTFVFEECAQEVCLTCNCFPLYSHILFAHLW